MLLDDPEIDIQRDIYALFCGICEILWWNNSPNIWNNYPIMYKDDIGVTFRVRGSPPRCGCGERPIVQLVASYKFRMISLVQTINGWELSRRNHHWMFNPPEVLLFLSSLAFSEGTASIADGSTRTSTLCPINKYLFIYIYSLITSQQLLIFANV